MLRRWPIRAQLLALALAVALPLIGLDAWNQYSSARDDAEHARQQVFRLAQIVASDTMRFLSDAKDTLDRVAAARRSSA